jgi:hypothetical protein
MMTQSVETLVTFDDTQRVLSENVAFEGSLRQSIAAFINSAFAKEKHSRIFNDAVSNRE